MWVQLPEEAKASGPLELESQVIMDCLTCVLGIELMPWKGSTAEPSIQPPSPTCDERCRRTHM